ncbi:MAG: hydroxyisourate hydrolase [Alphaproteobacteria bacterium]|nr:hydroxyisourate hydrolase [Alphaproteobacteria bacterium]
MAGLSTHILDTAKGGPAAGVRVELFEIVGEKRSLVCDAVTNDDGRTDTPLLNTDQMRPGTFEILFHIGEYFTTAASEENKTGFLNVVPVRFTITDAAQHYHVPLLASPWSYTTYRGS